MSTDENAGKAGNEKIDITKNNYDKVRFWDTQEAGFEFPEQTDSELAYAHLANTKDRGICFSGGGTVSVALIAGYLNALADLKLMEDIGYMSGVSGGTWGTAPFMYHHNDSDQELTGKHQLPDKLTPGDIDNVTPESLAGMCCNAKIGDIALGFLDYDTTQAKPPFLYNAYGQAVGQIFLQPTEIISPTHKFLSWEKDDSVPILKKKAVVTELKDRRSFFTTTSDVAKKIAKRNWGIEWLLKEKAFMTLNNPNRPYYIMNTTMLVPKEKGDKHPTVYPFEFTPLYAGMYPNQGKDPITKSQQLGGLYVESYGFNTVAKQAPDGGTIKAGNNYRLELCQPVGTSGAAVAEFFQSFKLPLKDALPNFKYWNPIGTEGKPTTERYYYGDGGIIENTGIISLLLRKVTNIVSFVSQMTYFFKNGDDNAVIDFTVSGYDQLIFGYNEIACLFGGQLIDSAKIKEFRKANKHATSMKAPWKDDDFDGLPAGARKVFEDDADHTNLDNLIAAFEFAHQNGGPVSANIQPTVIKNGLFGIKESYTPNIKFTMLGDCAQWTNQLQPDIKNRIGKGTLADFPNVKTFGQNPEKGWLIQLTPDQANMLGNLAYWAVMDEKEVYTSLMQGKGFPAGTAIK